MLRSSRTPWPQRRSEGHHPGVNAGSLDGPLPPWGKSVLREHGALSLAGSILCLPRHNPRTSQGMLWKSGRLRGKRSASNHDCLQANFQTFGLQLQGLLNRADGKSPLGHMLHPGFIGFLDCWDRSRWSSGTTFKYLL